jgi:hypothetical protein
MGPTPELIDALYRERVLRARQTAPVDKLFDGARLFDLACRVVKDGIRAQYPDADETRVDEILRERLALRERLENAR